MSGTLLQGPFGNRSMMRRPEEMDPFVMFRREMGRLFDDVLGGSMFPGIPLPAAPRILAMPLTPRLEVSESGDELQISAELPGIDAQNLEISLADDLLSIRAEKTAQAQEDGERDYHVNERSYGTFSRYLRLPFEPEPEQVRASFKDGVLTITIPKPEAMQRKVHRIDVQAEATPANTGAPEQLGSTEQRPAEQKAAE